MIEFPITDPVLKFALLFSVILAVPLLSRISRVPETAALIATGILLGPHVSGVLGMDSVIVGLGTSGLLYILFLAGVEVDLHDFRKVWKRGMGFGLLALLFPLGLGFAAFHGLFGFSWLKSLLLASLLSSQTPVVYPALARLGLVRRESVVVSIGATIVADTGALVALAFVANWVESGGDADAWRRFGICSGLFALGMGFVLPRIARAVFRNTGWQGGQSFLFVLVSIFSSAFMAHLAGLEAVLGAFFAGLALNRSIPEHSVLMNRLQFFGHCFFIPFFMIWVGMLLDVGALAGNALLWAAIGAMVFLALGSKWAAARASQWIFGYRSEDGWILFSFGSAKAAAALAAAVVGFRIGLFDAGILNGTILMIVVTCITASWIADRFGRRLALEKRDVPPPAPDRPAHFMVPVSNPDTAGPLIELAALIQKASRSREPLHVLHVVREEEELRGSLTRGRDVLRECALRGVASGVAIIPLIRVDLSVSDGLVRAAREVGADPVLLGWNAHPGPADRLFGSLLDHVMERYPGRIMVCRTDHAFATSRRIIVSWPPSAESAAGFDEGWADVKSMARQLSLKPMAFVPGDDAGGIRKRVERIRPDCGVDFVPAGSWRNLRSAIEEALGTQDIFIFLGAREGTVAWNPGINSFLRNLADRCRDVRLLAIYPPAPAAEQEDAMDESLEVSGLQIPSPGGIRLGLEDMPVEKAVEIMLAAAMPASPESVRPVMEALMNTAREYRAELAPGVALLHASDCPVRVCTLLIGLSARGLADPLFHNPVRAFFILLNPQDAAPDVHLKALASIARILRRPGAVSRLMSAVSEAEVRSFLGEPEQASHP